MELAFDKKCRYQLTDDVSLLLSVGIEFGAVGFGGQIEAVKRSGAAKIIAVV